MLAILGVLVGVGFAMIPLNFWVGVAISAVAAILLIIALYELVETRVYRQLGILSTFLVYVVIVWAIWIPASIDPFFMLDPGDYDEGADIYGVKRRSNFYELTLILWNGSNNDLTNLDIYLRTNLTIAAVGIAPSINTCTNEPHMPAAIGTGKMTQQDAEGKRHAVPVLQKGKLSATVWRIKCERLSANSQIEIELPITANLPQTNKQKPAWAKAWFRVMSGYRPVNFTHEQCFEEPCSGIPTHLSGEIIPSFSPWLVVGSVAFVDDPVLFWGLRLGSLQ